MIDIKGRDAIRKMEYTGKKLARLFEKIPSVIKPGLSTGELDAWIQQALKDAQLLSQAKGYLGYRHVSCISLNDEVVHGVPNNKKIIKDGDLVKIDVCAAYEGYCADMARCFFVGSVVDKEAQRLVDTAYRALDKGIEQARVGKRLSDISAAIQKEVEKEGFGVVRDFAGHGIGKKMHEDPEILNYGVPGQGPLLKEGMAFALEPMITAGNFNIRIMDDGWTAKTVDGCLAAHVEDTVIVRNEGPLIVTRLA